MSTYNNLLTVLDLAQVNILMPLSVDGFLRVWTSFVVMMTMMGSVAYVGSISQPQNLASTAAKLTLSWASSLVVVWLSGFSDLLTDRLGSFPSNALHSPVSFSPSRGWFTNPYSSSSIFTYSCGLAIVSCTILSGTLNERGAAALHIIVNAFWCGLLAPPMRSLVWSEQGVLYSLGLRDPSGATAFFLPCALTTAAASFMLGPRLCRLRYVGHCNQNSKHHIVMNNINVNHVNDHKQGSVEKEYRVKGHLYHLSDSGGADTDVSNNDNSQPIIFIQQPQQSSPYIYDNSVGSGPTVNLRPQEGVRPMPTGPVNDGPTMMNAFPEPKHHKMFLPHNPLISSNAPPLPANPLINPTSNAEKQGTVLEAVPVVVPSSPESFFSGLYNLCKIIGGMLKRHWIYWVVIRNVCDCFSTQEGEDCELKNKGSDVNTSNNNANLQRTSVNKSEKITRNKTIHTSIHNTHTNDSGPSLVSSSNDREGTGKDAIRSGGKRKHRKEKVNNEEDELEDAPWRLVWLEVLKALFMPTPMAEGYEHILTEEPELDGFFSTIVWCLPLCCVSDRHTPNSKKITFNSLTNNNVVNNSNVQQHSTNSALESSLAATVNTQQANTSCTEKNYSVHSTQPHQERTTRSVSPTAITMSDMNSTRHGSSLKEAIQRVNRSNILKKHYRRYENPSQLPPVGLIEKIILKPFAKVLLTVCRSPGMKMEARNIPFFFLGFWMFYLGTLGFHISNVTDLTKLTPTYNFPSSISVSNALLCSSAACIGATVFSGILAAFNRHAQLHEQRLHKVRAQFQHKQQLRSLNNNNNNNDNTNDDKGISGHDDVDENEDSFSDEDSFTSLDSGFTLQLLHARNFDVRRIVATGLAGLVAALGFARVNFSYVLFVWTGFTFPVFFLIIQWALMTFRIDDPADIISITLSGGLWGTMSRPVLINPSLSGSEGVATADALLAMVAAVAMLFACTIVATYFLFVAVRLLTFLTGAFPNKLRIILREDGTKHVQAEWSVSLNVLIREDLNAERFGLDGVVSLEENALADDSWFYVDKKGLHQPNDLAHAMQMNTWDWSAAEQRREKRKEFAQILLKAKDKIKIKNNQTNHHLSDN